MTICRVQVLKKMISAQSKDLKIFVGHGLFYSTTHQYCRSGPMVGIVRIRLPITDFRRSACSVLSWRGHGLKHGCMDK